MRVGILGLGEIGSSLHKVYLLSGASDVAVRDPFQGLDTSLSDCEIVNVCIPFSGYDAFSEVIRDLRLGDGCVVMIQSTVGMGCTDRLQADFPSLVCIHSPVRGVHPNLVEGLLTFDKYVGVSDRFGKDQGVKGRILQHIESIGIKPFLCRAKESELAKVVSTTLYGMNIAAITDVFKLCDDNSVDFDAVFTKWQTGYNTGYTSLGKPNVCRPVLTPVPRNPDGERVIGGHCVLPDCLILRNEFGETNISEFVLRYSDTEGLTHRAKSDAGKK
ncbi:unnamed protein product [Ectocarpus sp. 12 AP-2014]